MTDSKFGDKWSENNLGNQLILQERFHSIKKLLVRSNIKLHQKKILEVGCAGGSVISSLLDLGAIEENIHGIDIRSNRVDDAKKKYSKANFSIMDASKLDFVNSSFDVIIVFTLFSSVLDQEIRKNIANELQRVLKPKGRIVYYDFRFNNPFNKNVRGISKCEINKLFRYMDKKLKLITLLPPLSRKLGKLTQFCYPVFSTLPLFRSHYLGLFSKNE